MLNLTVMTGRMVETPELKTTANNVSVTVFRIAVSRNYKVNEEYPTDSPFNIRATLRAAATVMTYSFPFLMPYYILAKAPPAY